MSVSDWVEGGEGVGDGGREGGKWRAYLGQDGAVLTLPGPDDGGGGGGGGRALVASL